MDIDVKKGGNEKIEAVAVQGEQQKAVGLEGRGREEQPPGRVLFTPEGLTQPRKDEVRLEGVTEKRDAGRRARGRGQVK